jgi:hypothetical protein
VGEDAFDRAVCLHQSASRRREDVLGECWKDLGRPEHVHLDKARELVG